jgi:hypothetical protein
MTATPATATPVPRPVWLLGSLMLVLHLLPRPGYGFHRDELLYLAMADHLQFLRMQFPPLIAVLGRLARVLPLDQLAAVRLLPALAGTAILAVTVGLTRRLGGQREAQILAALSALVAPLLLRTGALFQPVVFEILWWSVAAFAFTALFGGLTKFSAAVFGAAMAVGVLSSPLRPDLHTRWPWLGALLGGAIALPSVLGQMHWGWPFLIQADVLRETQLGRVTATSFLLGQLMLAGAAAPLLVAGAIGLVGSPALRQFRSLSIVCAVAMALFLLLQGKEYYFGPMHPVLLAAGSLVAGTWLANRPRLWWAAIGCGMAGGLLLLPLGIPLLPPPMMARYTSALGITRAATTNRGTILPLPQDFADMLGWREQVAEVARVYRALPDSDRAGAVIVGGNYGRAGALAAYHREFGLPYPISRHGDFYNWGPGDREPTVVIVVGGTVPELQTIFGAVVEAGHISTPLGVEEEQEVTVHVCRNPRQPLRQLWRSLGPVWG